MQVYAPTTNSQDAEVDQFYEDLLWKVSYWSLQLLLFKKTFVYLFVSVESKSWHVGSFIFNWGTWDLVPWPRIKLRALCGKHGVLSTGPAGESLELMLNCLFLHSLLLVLLHVLFCTVINCIWTSQVAQRVKNLPVMLETQLWSLGWEDPPEKRMHSTILAWRIPWTEEPWGLYFMGHKVRHNWAVNTHKTVHVFTILIMIYSPSRFLVAAICKYIYTHHFTFNTFASLNIKCSS